MKIGVGSKLGVRYRIDVVLAIYSLTVVAATLPLPYVLARSELAEANQVGAAVALMIQLAGTLVENKLQHSVVVVEVVSPYIRIASTLTQLVYPVPPAQLSQSPPVRTTHSAYIKYTSARRKSGKSVSTPSLDELEAVVPSSFTLLHFSER